jgi:hypothetical protein
MKVTLFIIIVMLLAACSTRIATPVKVVEISQVQSPNHDNEPTCALRLEEGFKGASTAWTDYSPDNCQYKVGDVLK